MVEVRYEKRKGITTVKLYSKRRYVKTIGFFTDKELKDEITSNYILSEKRKVKLNEDNKRTKRRK